MLSFVLRSLLVAIFTMWFGNGFVIDEFASGSGNLPQNSAGVKRYGKSSVTCKSDPCGLNGFCVQLSSGFVCHCNSEWAGDLCNVQATTRSESSESGQESSETACLAYPCSNACSCVNSRRHEFGRICVSAEGFIGDSCAIEVPVVTCTPSQITISILPDFYREFDRNISNSYLYVSTSENSDHENCRAALVDGKFFISIPLPFKSCGMVTRSSGENFVFENRLWVNREINGLIDMPVPVVDFQCVYDQEYSVVSSLHPVVGNAQSTEIRTAEIGFRVELCKADVCPTTECPSSYSVNDGALYTVGEIIHFGVYGVSNSSEPTNPSTFVPTVQQLYISCSPNSSVPAIIQLTSNGCPTEPGFYLSVRAGDEVMSQAACVSFQLPRMSACNSIYIHAYIRMCLSEQLVECPNSPSTKNCARNSKRSSDQSELRKDSTMEVIGPIRFIEGSSGQSRVSIGSDEVKVEIYRPISDADMDDIILKAQKINSDFILFLVVAVVMLLSLPAFLLIYFKFSSTRQRHRAVLLNSEKNLEN